MSTITKEQLRERAREKVNGLEYALKHPGAFADTRAELEEELELARIALASLEAEPVAHMYKDNLHADARFSLHTRFGNWSQEDINEYEITEIPLYTAPPVPVFPRDLEEIIFTIVNAMADEKLRNDENELFSLAKKYIEHAKSKLSAAMLQGADGNSPVIPDGLCPCCGRKPLKNKTCSVAGCNGKHVARGFCVKHYAIERKKEPSRRESIRAADKRYRARKAAAPQQEVKP